MLFGEKTTRRSALTVLLSSLGIGAITHESTFAAKKKPGETRVIFLVGDYWHNGVTQEKNWRHVLGPSGFRLMFAQGSRFVTPEALEQTDLFIVARYAKANSLGFSGDEIVEKRMEELPFLTDEREQAIIDNVNRGMGLLAMHCTIWNGESPKFLDLLGVDEPHMHTKVQPALLHKLNQDHPITRGIEACNIVEDEIFSADLTPGRSTTLFNLKGDEQPIDTTGGWCHDYGNGRVVVLLPGHNPHPFHKKSFKEIMWRSAYWAMKKDIPAYAFEDGRPPEKSIY
ncbi:MAG: ThuA domain-containing protein [Candidatus Latescibacteria bacterium]|nr:ThuA domain-containing protein [Candidatus Latescibacterota bacterium]